MCISSSMSEEVRGQLARVILSSPMWVPGAQVLSKYLTSSEPHFHYCVRELWSAQLQTNEWKVCVDWQDWTGGRAAWMSKEVCSVLHHGKWRPNMPDPTVFPSAGERWVRMVRIPSSFLMIDLSWSLAKRISVRTRFMRCHWSFENVHAFLFSVLSSGAYSLDFENEERWQNPDIKTDPEFLPVSLCHLHRSLACSDMTSLLRKVPDVQPFQNYCARNTRLGWFQFQSVMASWVREEETKRASGKNLSETRHCGSSSDTRSPALGQKPSHNFFWRDRNKGLLAPQGGPVTAQRHNPTQV